MACLVQVIFFLRFYWLAIWKRVLAGSNGQIRMRTFPALVRF
jgi:hypothetical protein